MLNTPKVTQRSTPVRADVRPARWYNENGLWSLHVEHRSQPTEVMAVWANGRFLTLGQDYHRTDDPEMIQIAEHCEVERWDPVVSVVVANPG